MATITTPEGLTQTPSRNGTLTDWRPEDPEFWESTGKEVARRNLIWSIFAENLAFSVWLFWSVSAAMLAKMGFEFSVSQLFLLVALPNLVGAVLRVPYTVAVPRFGGRNWTVISALLLLVPTLLFAWAVQHPGTPFWAFMLISATAGFGGGNFASSMANINHFYPSHKKGTGLGLNAAGGNLGVGMIQFLLPVIVGGAGIFGLVKAAESGINLQRAGYLYAVLAILAALGAYFFMNNLVTAKAPAMETFAVLRYKHTWVMSFLYIGTFGSFIGYSAAMPLLIKINFWVPAGGISGTGINFAYYAFLGGTIGSIARPLGGWLADRYGGARVTIGAFLAMILGTLAILFTLSQLTPNPDKTAAIALENQSLFPWFLVAFLFVFAATGVGNGSTYRMIPLIWQHAATRATTPGTVERDEALVKATKEGSNVLGICGAMGAFGGFLIPMMFGAPWVGDPVAAVRSAFALFTVYYVACLAVTWFVYTRKAFVHRVPSLAHAGV